MTVPKYDKFFVPVLHILANGKIHTSDEILTLLADESAVTEKECSRLLPNGRSRVLNGHIGWTRAYLKEARLIESPKRDTCRITRPDKEALASGAQVDNDYLERYESSRFLKNLNDDSSTHTTVDDGLEKRNGAYSPEKTPGETFGRTFSSINMRLAGDSLSEVLKLSPIAFERFVLGLMAKMGYGAFGSASQTTSISGDKDIDGIVMEDKLGLDLIYVQAKRYAEDETVGRPDIQAFVGAVTGREGKGLFITIVRFTEKTITYVKRQHIVLVDGHKFAQLMIEHGFGVSTRRIYEIKAVDSDVFNEYVDEE